MASLDEIFTLILTPMTQLFSPPRKFTSVEQDAALAEYSAALEPFSAADLALAWQIVRSTQLSRYWPAPAVLVQACRSSAGNKAQIQSEGRITDNGWQPWGGGCKCERCANMVPSPGFFRASPEQKRAGEQLRRELAEFNWLRMYGPGTPPVPEFTGEEIHITPERAAQVIAATRKRLNYGYSKSKLPAEDEKPFAPAPYTDEELASIRALHPKPESGAPSD